MQTQLPTYKGLIIATLPLASHGKTHSKMNTYNICYQTNPMHPVFNPCSLLINPLPINNILSS